MSGTVGSFASALPRRSAKTVVSIDGSFSMEMASCGNCEAADVRVWLRRESGENSSVHFAFNM